MSAIKGQDYAAISYDLTERQVAILSDYINAHNYYSVFPSVYVCSSFSVGCWNKVVPSSYQLSTSIVQPKKLADAILDSSLPSAPLPSTNKHKSTIAYHTSTGVEYDSGTLSILTLPI